MHLKPDSRIALLMHEGTQSTMGKTGLALLRFSQSPIVAVIDYQAAGRSLHDLTGIDKPIPVVASLTEALTYTPDVLAIGIAPSGGKLPDAWFQEIEQAVKAGLSIVNGLHTPMSTHPALQPWLRDHQWIWDVRQEPEGLTVGSGQASQLNCKRILTVGTDMSVGKMSATLELHRACLQRGLRSKVIATGQTNLMLGDDGVPLDAIRVDYASGAVEQQLMRHGPHHDFVFVEGQGSLLNPASTATLPLLRGTQPTHLVLVHRAGQNHIHNFPQVKIPDLPSVIALYEQVTTAAGAFHPAKVVAIALNTGHLTAAAAEEAIQLVEAQTELPCADIFRTGADKLLTPILA
ncbi:MULTISPECIES: DUF1611 domain-containing protein [Cyanophyceae]|uniref:DUF1611 domain-containing protein n=1 Tax=Leptolyngbya subtilissima DQ-A4 TaxID=2933933 RepID=A0ABV0K063_9CYAN|nr:DUF1611 domain-containing protein [Nodosilinea sp. FACHB-141]MBD2111951.1 DUF1611 domain-containing protein [Nodosilinea sp. FACHB-141]